MKPIRIYRDMLRLLIFSQVAKNACRMEALQMGHIGQLELTLAVYLVASWRLARLVSSGETHLNLGATELFTDEERQGRTSWQRS
ncbi:MAG TPA: hypothetical protein DIS62_00630 [Candidatus Kerfeldbacteria bacterium]|nr:hypothetical protein [Candidatus Kerfeldbacteria bacterium]